MTNWRATAGPILTIAWPKIIGAIMLYMNDRWLIGIAIDMMQRMLTACAFDPTLRR